MIGILGKLLGRGLYHGTAVGLKGAGKGVAAVAGRKGPRIFGKVNYGPGSGDPVRRFGAKLLGRRGYQYAHRAAGGALGGAVVGTGMSLLTGNWNYLPSMAAFGAMRGGLKYGAARRAKGGAGRNFGWFNPNRMTRNFAIGTAIGAAPGLWGGETSAAGGFYGAVGLPAAGWMLKTSIGIRGVGRLAAGGAVAPFAPHTATKIMGNVSVARIGAAGGTLGLIAGAGVEAHSAFSLSTRKWKPYKNDMTSGYFPGGTMALGPGRGQGIPNNHLSSEGLTLALHRHSRSISRVM